MKILIVGSGGREHAIAWKLAQSPKVSKLYCAPGNAGISEIAECVNIKGEDIQGICKFAKEHSIDMAVIGPEVPLAMGIVDSLMDIGIKTFGPDKNCAQLEASKAFTKSFLDRHDIPTAGYKEFTDKEELLNSVGIFGYPMVLKADGLAAGKGVVIAENKEDAEKAIEDMMGSRVFGDAGDRVVVEEFLTGIEASMLCFVDEETIVPMESAQDYKRIFNGDKGPNTGGMGTYSPSLIFTPELELEIKEKILIPTLKGFQEDGLKFRGVLFIGLMINEEGPKVIEFNNRFGDPETQSILVRLETDLVDIFQSVIDGKLKDQEISWSKEKAVCVVLASGGYPCDYKKGEVIHGLEQWKMDGVNGSIAASEAGEKQDVIVFHAGTKFASGDQDGQGNNVGALTENNTAVATDGGRVLGLVALGKTHQEARTKAYENVKKITFEGVQYRTDIGVVLK